MSAPPAGFSEDVAIPPDGGLIVKLLLEAKNATKTAKKFSGVYGLPTKGSPSSFQLTVEHPHRPLHPLSGFRGLISSPGGVS